MDQGGWQKMHLKDLLFLLPKISFFPNLHPEMFPEYVFERGFTNSASFLTEKRGASFSQFPLVNIDILKPLQKSKGLFATFNTKH